MSLDVNFINIVALTELVRLKKKEKLDSELYWLDLNVFTFRYLPNEKLKNKGFEPWTMLLFYVFVDYISDLCLFAEKKKQAIWGHIELNCYCHYYLLSYSL